MPTFTFETRLPMPQTSDELHGRIRALVEIKDELDREIAILQGKRIDFEPGKPWHCVRCDHVWVSRLPGRPRMCPKCKVAKFDSKPRYTYAERAKRRIPRLDYARAQAREEIEKTAPLPHSVITRALSPEDDIGSVALTPPPVPTQPTMSLRERLALLKSQPAAGSESDISSTQRTLAGLTDGAAADGAHPEPNESATEEDLVQAINGETDAT